MTKFHQGKYAPRNPEKYVGDVNNIIYRSGWEKRLLIMFDTNPNVLKYSSEEVIVPYFCPVSNKMRRYFPDFVATMRTKTGEIVQIMIEVKPFKQTKPPEKPKKVTKRFLEEVETYAINNAKWLAAKKFCDQSNMKFQIITERELGI